MSKKITKPFYFVFPVRRTVIKNGKRERVLVSTLEIEGIAYCYPNVPKTDIDERYDFDIDVILKNGTDIKPELEEFDAMDKISAATLDHISKQFGGEYIDHEDNVPDEPAPSVTGCNDRKESLLHVLRVFDPLNNIIESYKPTAL